MAQSGYPKGAPVKGPSCAAEDKLEGLDHEFQLGPRLSDVDLSVATHAPQVPNYFEAYSADFTSTRDGMAPLGIVSSP